MQLLLYILFGVQIFQCTQFDSQNLLNLSSLEYIIKMFYFVEKTKLNDTDTVG